MNKWKVDRKWFLKQISKSPYRFQTQLAKRLLGRNGKPLDQSVLVRILNGQRYVTLDEARNMADLLHLPLLEIIHHFGFPVYEWDVPKDFNFKI